MKTIYTFTLEGDNYLSKEYDNNLRLLAHMLYNSIYNYYGVDEFPLDINENIEYNKINEDYEKKIYMLDSEIYDDSEYVYYDPFLIGDKSFGLTIADETFDIDIIQKILDENLRLLGLDSKVIINSFKYDSKDQNDEINRAVTIKNIFDSFGCKQKKSGFLNMFIRYGKHNRRSSHRR